MILHQSPFSLFPSLESYNAAKRVPDLDYAVDWFSSRAIVEDEFAQHGSGSGIECNDGFCTFTPMVCKPSRDIICIIGSLT